jgi:alpha-glucosidase
MVSLYKLRRQKNMAKDTEHHEKVYSRRRFLYTSLATPLLITAYSIVSQETASASDLRLLSDTYKAKSITSFSPNHKLQFEIFLTEQGQVSYRIALGNQAVIETSVMAMIVDNIDLCQGTEITGIERYRVIEKYLQRGIHSEALNQCNGAKISFLHRAGKTAYTIETRTFNEGIAFRCVIPGNGKQRVPDEATTFTIPTGSAVWYHDFEGHYESPHTRKNISDIKAGEWAALPLTIKLPNGAGYAAISEAALINYSGMGLEADGQRGLKTRLGHALPVSYPFRLRYATDIERLAKPAALTGTITTPWRVVMVGADLNALVNCDMIENVSPPPDRKIFPAGINTDWLKPGRAVWKYLDGGENTLEEMKNFSALAGKLGFEYNVVEGFWQKWSEAEMRELVDYSRQHKVGVWFWKHSRDLRTPEARQQFFKLLNHVGVVGAKIDFFDHEAKEIIDLYQVLLKEAAEHKIMLNFHGANKPAGESRTWPNEMTREAIRGMEARKMETRAVHNTTLPFTRMLAGHADYTAMLFGERRRETSWAHQIASAAILTSPVLIYGAHPKNILDNPAVDMIKSVPSVWDETIALPVCEIGEIAAFARRRDNRWFLAIMNGSTARSIKVPLTFLGRNQYQAMLVRDRQDDAAAVEIENIIVSRKDSLTIALRAGGGFIARFAKSLSD